MYQALYRKWRPRTFDDVVGQEHVTETLKNQITGGRLSHAYLFIGTRGTGKTSCAKILAKAVNCEYPENGNPCNKCRSCLGIDDGSIMDVVELDAASNNGVDNVRALRDEAVFSPVIVKKRVYIIDEVHMLSSSAFNALLKILEEPPEHLLFILATTELHKVPATILSRCQRHSFKRIDPEKLAKRLSDVAHQENMRLEPNAAELLARLADGSLRDGLSLLDQCSGQDTISTEHVLSAMGLAGNLKIAELLDVVSNGDTEKALSIFGTLWQDGKSPVTLLAELGSLLRDILMLKVAPKGGSELLSGGFDKQTLSSFAKRLTSEELICGIDSVQEHVGSLRDGRDPKTTAELCLIGLCEPKLGDSINTLKKRIAKLETMISEGSVAARLPEPDRFKNIVSEKTPPPAADDSPPFDLDEKNTFSQKDINRGKKAEEMSLEENELEQAPVDDAVPPFEIGEEQPSVFKEIAPKDKVDSPADGPEIDDAWTEIVRLLKGLMQPGQFSIISNEQMVKGELKGDELTISVPNAFLMGQLEQPQSMNSIKNASQKAIGRPIRVKIIEIKPTQTEKAGKLEGLSKFGNVKFE